MLQAFVETLVEEWCRESCLMNRYRGDDMDKMQQEAMRRMQEMQNRGKQTAEQPVKQEQEKKQDKPIKPNKQQQPQIKHKSFMDTLLQDKERSLILLLLLLLSTEKCDTGLILALMYLLI